MQIYRWIVLAVLAGLTMVLLGTAVLAYQSPAIPTPAHDSQLNKGPAWQKEIPPAIDLAIQQTGIAAVTASQLLSHNFRVPEFSAAHLRLSHNGRTVPFYIQGTGPDTTLYFYAEAITSTLTGPAVYRLSQEPGEEMVIHTAAPAQAGLPEAWHVARWEANDTFLPDAPGDDHWLGQLLLAPTEWQIPLSDVQANGRAAELTLRLISNNDDPANPDHHIQLWMNGRFLTDVFWDGIQQKTITLPLAAGALQNGEPNVLTIGVPGDTGAAGEAIYLDWIELRYNGPVETASAQTRFQTDADTSTVAVDSAQDNLLVFDITDAHQPILLTDLRFDGRQTHLAANPQGGEYVALNPQQAIQPSLRAVPQWPQSLLAQGRGAAYVAIVADEPGFIDALAPLLSYRANQGFTPTAVSLTQIYDEFGYGQQDPAAIRAFLAYAAQNWQPAPQFVLLVGDATYDMQAANDDTRNLLPTYLERQPDSSAYAHDGWFVTFPTHHSPAMSIGRFPVKTLAQLDTLVAKTIAYEYALADGVADPWQRQALLIADDEPAFDAISDSLETTLADSGYQIHDLHMSTKENIRFDIISALNKGVGIVNYTGHGDAVTWGDEAVFQVQDAAMLGNGSRLPILTAFNCQSGDFSDPGEDSLAENLLWSEKGGIVAAIGPSARLSSGYSLDLVNDFYGQFLNGRAHTLGEALLATQTAAEEEQGEETAVYTLNLLGDPALSLPKP